jgi:LAO/AO transport system kinase
MNEVLDSLASRDAPRTMRIGVSGAPGAGKSTLIESLGMHLVGLGHRVAVLAIDPTSGRSGGSILGDKTRMSELATNSNAYVRPSPAGSSLGGVARTTGASILLCEAAGFDTILVETVGVGQSETAVADITDLFLLLVAPAAGDDLQGIKRGVMELADVVAVTKHDGPLRPIAEVTASAYAGALSLIRPKHASLSVPTLNVSAVANEGIAQLWSTLADTHQAMVEHGLIQDLRTTQAASAFWAELAARASEAHRRAAAGNPELALLVEQVSAGHRHPRSAASQFWQSQ